MFVTAKRCWLLCAAGLLCALATTSANEPAAARSKQAGNSVGAYLAADGSLDLPVGFSGSLDPEGFEMISGPNGEPRFVRPGAAGQKLFGVPGGCNGEVEAIAVAPSGLVYLGGRFSVCEDVRASRVVAYNPQSRRFQSLGSGSGIGAEGRVDALEVVGSDLYAGGTFTQVDGRPANRIARWNGSGWSALGSGADNGVNNWVLALAAVGDDLYVGGFFTEAGGSPANYIARWDGSDWSTLGSGAAEGVNDWVRAFAVSGNDLYVGGEFDLAGGQPANKIVRWADGAWSALGSGEANGVDNDVQAIAVAGNNVYAGGNLQRAGGQPAAWIARWDGSDWSAMTSAGLSVSGTVLALAVSGDDLIVGGFFSRAGGRPANRIARWDGSEWSALVSGTGNGVTGSLISQVRALAVLGDDLYVGGEFSQAGGQPANRAARWDGSTWSALGSGVGNGVDNVVDSLAIIGSDLYVGGFFTLAGGQSANRIARWNGSAWFALGSAANNGVGGRDAGSVINGVTTWVDALAVSDSGLYVGGDFTEAGGQPAKRVARWDGSAWSALGAGVGDNSFNDRVYALAVVGTDLYVGGFFSEAGGQEANNIARWNGATWSALGSGAGNGVSSSVYALAVSGDDLYVGGFFTRAGGQAANYIARWNGSDWSALGSGVGREPGTGNPGVNALAVAGDELYVGGSFTEAGGQPANNVARWNGAAWSPLGSGVSSGTGNAEVHTLAVAGSSLYVGGLFTQAGDQQANGLAHWNGSVWEGLSTDEPSQIVSALASDSDSIYVGGTGLTQTPLPELQTRALGGLSANSASSGASASRNGNRIVFSSRASDLTSDGDSFSDIYLRDTQTGEITRLSAATPNAKGSREEFFEPAISPGGSTVAYAGSSGQVFADLGGLGRTVSSSRSGTPGNGESGRPMTPGSGSMVMFDTDATNLLDTPDGNGTVRDIVSKDLNTGAVSLITVGPGGEPANGDSFGPWASADGQAVAFWSLATNLSDESVSAVDASKMGTIRQALVGAPGGTGRSATYVSRNLSSNQLGNGDSVNVRLTPDARFGVFESVADNLVDGDNNGVSDIFRFELESTGGRVRLLNLERVSVSRLGIEGNGPSYNASISDDGLFVTFQTDASNLVELDRNNATDVLVKWMVTKEVVRLSRTVDGEQPNGDSIDPMISGDGSVIVFGSGATNLTENDGNAADDVFAVRLRESSGPALIGGSLNYSYTYWNPNEPGWGYNLQHQGDLLYGTWYTYADDGQVMFLTVEATAQSQSSFAGPVYRVAGTPFDQINGSQAFTSITEVGSAQMNFAADGGLTLTYTVNGVTQVKALERFTFSERAPSCVGTTDSRAQAANYSDLWWNATEPGWGLTLAHQGDVVFLLWYTYGVGGRDQWVSASSLVRQPDGSFSGELQRPASGTPLAQIAGPATTFPVPGAGTATLRFTDGESGSFEYTLDGVTQSKAIQRFVVVGVDQAKPLCAE